MSSIITWFRENKKYLWILLIIILSIILFSFMYKGFFSRYQQDDYCYGANFLKDGFLKTQYQSYTTGTGYNGNRYSLTLLYGLAEFSGGTSLQRWVPGISILAWLFSLTFLVFQLFKTLYTKIKIYQAAVIGLIILIFTLYLAPDLYQVLDWRPGSFTYLPSLVINTYLLARMLDLRVKEIRWHHVFEIGVLSFIGAGFSETNAVLQLCIWAIFLFLVIILKNTKRESGKLKALLLFILVFTILGILLLALSPSNNFSMNAASVKRADFQTLISLSFRYGFDFLNYSLSGKWLPFGILFISGFVLSFLLGISTQVKTNKLLFQVLGIILGVYLISVACTAPTVLIRSVFPEDRAHFPVHYILVLGIFSIGFLLARILINSRFYQQKVRLFKVGNGILVVGLFFYLIRMIPIVYAGISPLQARADAWDQREAWILSERNTGKTQITVPAFDSIARISELKADTNFWVNVCAARYYGVDGITAIENINGVKPYFK